MSKLNIDQCRGRKVLKNGCTKTIIAKCTLEKIVIDSITQSLSQPDIMNKLINKLLEIQEQQTKENKLLNKLLSEQRQNDIALENMMKVLEQGIITRNTKQHLKQLEEKQEQLEMQITAEKSKKTTILTEDKIRKYYAKALNLSSKLLIEVLIDKIILFDDKIEIYYNSPIQKSPDTENQGFCFYVINKNIMIIKNQSLTEKLAMQIEMWIM